MVKSVYVLGGSAVGKSSFSQKVIDGLGDQGARLSEDRVDLHQKPNKRYTVTLRGQEFLDGIHPRGIYLGYYRDSYPGSDGLDRASSPAAAEWLTIQKEYGFIFSEGATLSTDRFLGALAEETELLVVHLVCDPMETELRMWGRGDGPSSPSFATGTATRSANRVANLPKGTAVLELDTSSDSTDDIDAGVESVLNHLIDD